MVERIVSLLAAWATLIGGVWLLFSAIEATTTSVAKRKVADWLNSIATKSISQTIVESPRWFIEAFDRIFGDRHLSLRCFSRSCVASIMAVLVITIMWVVLDPTSFKRFFSSEGVAGIFAILVFALMLNLVPDYLSLLETRLILRRVAHAGAKSLIVVMILDVIITGGIFFCWVVAIFLILALVIGEPVGVNVDEYLEFLSGLILFRVYEDPPITLGIFFYSTYFTSVWLHLFIVSSVATNLLYSLGRIGNWVMALLDIEGKPFQSMGLIAVGLLTIAFAIYAIMGVIG